MGKKNLMNFFFGKIYRKLLISYFLILVLIMGSGILLSEISQNELKKSIGENSVILTSEGIDKIDRTIHSRIEEIEFYVSGLSFQENLIESNKEFEKIENIEEFIQEKDNEWTSIPKNESNDFIESITNNKTSKGLQKKFSFYEEKYGYKVFAEVFVTNKYGVNIAQTGKTTDYYQADEEWWQKAKANGLFVGDTEYDESSGIYSIEIGVRIEDEQKNFLGVIKAVYNIQEVIEIMKELEDSSSGHENHKTTEFKLLKENGDSIYSTSGFNIMECVPEKIVSQIKNKENGYFIEICVTSKQEELFAFAKSKGYKSYKGNNWTLMIQHETKEIFAPIDALSTNMIAIIGLISIIAIIIALYLSSSISNPIKKLEKANSELEKGNFNVKLNINTKDELENLGKTFNKTIQALGKMNEEHKQLEKAKTEFLSITSHELRSPMTSMKAQLQMLLEEYYGKLNTKQKEAIEIILRNTSRLDNIIVDFLEISRIEAARLKFRFIKTNLIDYIKNLVEEMEVFLPEKNIKIKLNIEELPEIEVDPDRTMQVLRNLINNAKKFSPNNSIILVDIKPEKKFIKFTVKDQGIGVSPENQQKIFEPFYQTENMYQHKSGGTGLGLTICKGIIESQKGKIWVESQQGKGSTFYFTVPFTPIKEIKPIKLLFSEKESIDKKINETFKEILGPMGEQEFQKIQEKGLLKEPLIEYIEFLKDKKIIQKEEAEEFKRKILLVLEEKVVK